MKKIYYKLLRFSGLPFLFRELIQKNKVTILLFHDLNYQTADKTFNYLKKKYNIIDLNVLKNAIENSDASLIPPKALIITFDDGHIRNFEMQQTIIEHKIPITIFLCASIINTNRGFWFKHKQNDLSISYLKRISNTDRLRLLSNNNFDQLHEYDAPQALQMDHINAMKPYVNFQSHTMFHPVLPNCDFDTAKTEIVLSKQKLEEDFKLQIYAISYPNGDYSDRDIDLSKAAGYKFGITVDYGFNTINTDPFKLKRISVNDTEDINELIAKACGAWAFFKTFNGLKQGHGYTKITK